jgi:single-strand DNA-binding protein
VSVNKVILLGRLGADPETRTTQSGMAICNLRIATDGRKKVNGQYEKVTEWHRVVVFDKTAENAARFLKKGKQVYVEGELRTSKYTDKNGVEKYSTEVICNSLIFVSPKDEGSGGGDYQANTGDGGGTDSGSDDPLPF